MQLAPVCVTVYICGYNVRTMLMRYLILLLFFGCQTASVPSVPNEEPLMEQSKNMETATFAGGCFWCTEAVFLELDGVVSVVSGYIGGRRPHPTYEQVTSGATGHAEAVQIQFDADKISFGELLEIFFATHDPTTLNRQGNDVGTQYRSEIFYHNESQQQLSRAYIELLNRENTYGKPVVTAVSAASVFYPAEDYHQNYYAQNKRQPYCVYVVTPKVEKVRTKFSDKLKK